jgi:hypothetical protein
MGDIWGNDMLKAIHSAFRFPMHLTNLHRKNIPELLIRPENTMNLVIPGLTRNPVQTNNDML